ncbi:ribulose-phosphate 3-epimerase [Candidatus Dependentiae bacterium]|nr:ribulose-phosphate 3-epimerase [Candidatus Dependentiae bacterium]
MASIYPSLIASNLLNIKKTITLFDPHCSGYHLDIMDDHFVPNLTWGPMFINAIAKATTKKLWVHLMVENPSSFLDRLSLPPGSIFTFHIESKGDHEKLIDAIKEKKWKPSIAINPKTNPKNIFNLLDKIDQVLVMSVEPGFSGQSFLPDSLKKIEKLADHRKKNNLSFSIAIDGGIHNNNIVELKKVGADEFGIASAIFKQQNPLGALEKLQKLIK